MGGDGSLRHSVLLGVLVIGCLAVCIESCTATTVTYQVSAGADDADSYSRGYSSSFLIVGYDYVTHLSRAPEHMAGMRFGNVRVPNGAFITEAHLKIQNSIFVWFPGYPVYGVIHAEAADDPANFASAPPGSRPKTDAAVNWDHTTTGGSEWLYTSPDIKTIVQEVVNRPGWEAGNAMVILYSTRKNAGQYRWFWSCDSGPGHGPQLQISYEEPRVISGYVTKTNGTPIEGAAVDVNNGGWSGITDANGYYEVVVPDSWSGTVSPERIGYSFDPPTHSYIDVTSDLPDQNFTGTSNHKKTAATYQVSASNDDGYAYWWGFNIVDSHALAVGYNGSTDPPILLSGMRFRNVQIPKGVVIADARLKIRSEDALAHLSDLVYADIRAVDADDPGGFDSVVLASCPKTSTAVSWDLLSRWSRNTWYTSPNISTVIQDVIERPGWSPGNSLAILYCNRRSEGGYRFFYSYRYSASCAAKLEITFGEPPPGDFDWDWDVDLLDFAVFASQWQGEPSIRSADIAPEGGDGWVDVTDLGVFANYWLWMD